MLPPATAPGPAPRRSAGAGPRPERTGARRASRADWPEPAGCGRHQRRREPTAAPFGCRRSGATARARRRRRGTRVPQVEQHRRLPEAVIMASCASRARRFPRILKPEDRDAGRAKRRISPPPANNPSTPTNSSGSDSGLRLPTTARLGRTRPCSENCSTLPVSPAPPASSAGRSPATRAGTASANSGSSDSPTRSKSAPGPSRLQSPRSASRAPYGLTGLVEP